MDFIRFTTAVLSPLGQVYVGYTDRGISYLTSNVCSDQEFATVVRERHGCGVWRDDSLQVRWQDALNGWLAGSSADIDLDLSRVTPFEREVMLKAITIPRGSVRPYQWLARAVGRPGASRAVGGVMRRNPIPLLVPCHRVVASSGVIGNYSMGGPSVKGALLKLEGVDLMTLKQQVGLAQAVAQ